MGPKRTETSLLNVARWLLCLPLAVVAALLWILLSEFLFGVISTSSPTVLAGSLKCVSQYVVSGITVATVLWRVAPSHKRAASCCALLGMVILGAGSVTLLVEHKPDLWWLECLEILAQLAGMLIGVAYSIDEEKMNTVRILAPFRLDCESAQNPSKN